MKRGKVWTHQPIKGSRFASNFENLKGETQLEYIITNNHGKVQIDRWVNISEPRIFFFLTLHINLV